MEHSVIFLTISPNTTVFTEGKELSFLTKTHEKPQRQAKAGKREDSEKRNELKRLLLHNQLHCLNTISSSWLRK